MRTITLNRNDYHFWNGDTTLLLSNLFNSYTPEQMDAENKIPNWISKRWAGHWGYCDNNGIEFKVIFV